MNAFRVFRLLLFVALSCGSAAPEKATDPETLKDKVSIAVGKTRDVRFERDGNRLTDPKAVEKLDDKSGKTVSLDLRNQNGNLMLVTKNPFPKPMKFRALARQKGRKDYYETSIVPVPANLVSLEVWREPIEELVLFDFHLAGE